MECLDPSGRRFRNPGSHLQTLLESVKKKSKNKISTDGRMRKVKKKMNFSSFLASKILSEGTKW